MKKKLLSLVLALTMTLSMGTVAMADEPMDASVTTNTVTIYKDYVANEENDHDTAKSPAETLSFTVNSVSIEDAGTNANGVVDITVDSMPKPTIDNVSIEEDAADINDGTKHEITVKLPAYSVVGVYTYEITENDGNMAGVEYLRHPIKLVVTVQQAENGKIVVAGVHCEDPEDGDAVKVDSFENTYSAGKLAISKTVTGNLGDQTKKFNVKVTFNAPTGETVGAAITYRVGTEALEITKEEWNNGTVEKIIALKHGETITFENIPYGVKYTVEETDYTADGYDAAVYRGTDITNKNIQFTGDNSVTEGSTEKPENISIDAAEQNVTIENHKAAEVDTGINLDSMPYILILAAVAVGGVAIISKKRREEF